MTTYVDLTEQTLKTIRKTLVKQALESLKSAESVFILPHDEPTKYGYMNKSDDIVKIPKKPGIYVFYSKHTNRPVYVGESDHLKRELDREIRPTGTSLFKSKWIREWLKISSHRLSREDNLLIAQFTANNMYLKYLILYFGRAEICSDVAAEYKLRVGPNAVDFHHEFPDWIES